MSVSAKAFTAWRQLAAPGESTAALCRLAGIKRSTLAQQLVRGKVSESTVVRVARACDLEPVQALSYFEEYSGLAAGVRPPLDAELISQVNYVSILKVLVARSEGEDRMPELSAYPHPYSVRAWFDAVDPGDLRQRLAAETGVAPQNLSAQLQAGRLSPELAVAAGRLAGVSLASGLVVTGVLTPDEAGWPLQGREQALFRLSASELVLLARDRLEVLGKALRKMEHDENRKQTLLENLG